MPKSSFLLSPELATKAGGPPLIAVNEASKAFRLTSRHSHARGQLLGSTQGLISIETNDSQWVVPATYAAWIPPHVEHGLQSHGEFAGWSVYVSPDLCSALPVIPCIIAVNPLLKEAVLRAASWKYEDSLNDSKNRLSGVILDEILSSPHEHLGLSLPHDPRLLKIARALLNDPSDSRGISEWADWASVSVRTITRKFPSETGFSFTLWRQRVRLLRALEMLTIGQPVTNVALDLGYENISTFISLFKRTFGVTPGQYATQDKL